MNLHFLHDTKDERIVSILKEGLSCVLDERITKNYNPKYSEHNANLFYLLEHGRYRSSKGKFFVLENNGKFVACAGWNEYDEDPNIALLLTRVYIAPEYRANYFLTKYFLPAMLPEALRYSKIWMTFNSYNKVIYDWFIKINNSGQDGFVAKKFPIFKSFKPIGVQLIYFTDQYVIEYQKQPNEFHIQ